jgi:hypothetical protein
MPFHPTPPREVPVTNSLLLIESRDPFLDLVQDDLDHLTESFAAAGTSLSLLLVENGVLTLRMPGWAAFFARLRSRRVEVLADGFSLRERGVHEGQHVPGTQVVSAGDVVDRLARGTRAVWL